MNNYILYGLAMSALAVGMDNNAKRSSDIFKELIKKQPPRIEDSSIEVPMLEVYNSDKASEYFYSAGVYYVTTDSVESDGAIFLDENKITRKRKLSSGLDFFHRESFANVENHLEENPISIYNPQLKLTHESDKDFTEKNQLYNFYRDLKIINN